MKAAFARFQWPYARVRPSDEVQVDQAIAASDDTVILTLEEPTCSESVNDPLLAKSGEGEVTPADKNIENAQEAAWGSNRLKALGCIIVASLTFSIASACVKYESSFMGSQETVFWRSAIGLVLNYLYLRRKRVSLVISPRRRWLLLFRILVGTFGMSIQFYAMSNMVLTDATVIMFTSPIVTFLLGAAVLREKIERLDFVCALVSYIGVIFVARPASLFPGDQESAKESHPLAVLAALGGAVTQAIVYVCMRKMHDLDPLAMTHYFMMFATLFSICSIAGTQQHFIFPTEGWAIFALVATATFSSVGQIFMTLGFQHEKAGIASVMRYFDVLFVLILDVVVLREQVSVYSIVGGTIILVGAVVIVMRRAHRK